MSEAHDRAILPQPPEHLKQRSEALAGQLRAAIEDDGPMPFSEWMERVLYEPGLGYYSAGLHKFGASGDFVTAPELGGLFAGCLARQVAEIGAALGDFEILEIGAGSGALAAGLLNVLPGDQRPARYRILERSADLRAVQRDTLEREVPGLLERVEWLDTPPDQPWRGVLLANEVVDALAVERFRVGNSEIRRAAVGLDGDGFAWTTVEAPPALAAAARQIADRHALAPGYVSELCLQLPAWIEAVTASLERGVALFVDYGYPRGEYYLPERSDGTLVCHFRHRAHGDPFLWPGLQDISAFVDFTALAEAGEAAGLELAGYTSQALFLLALGLAADLPAEGMAPGATLGVEARRLTLPGEMGERFQVMALGRDFDAPLSGFALRDLRHRL